MSFGLLNLLLDWPTWLIVTLLIGMMLAALELGFRGGRRPIGNESELSRTVANSFKGSIFGLVGLLLGFSFSATTSRYDLRQRVVLDQANAIGTCFQRAGLLDDATREKIRSILRHYIEYRVKQYRAGSDRALFARAQEEIDRQLAELWATVEEANRREPEMVRNSLIVSATNDVIDLSSTRTWANQNHLPEPVLALLIGSVLVACVLLGHSSGQARRRHVFLWVVANVMFALVLFVVLDFDRPRRGLILVDPTPLLDLAASVGVTPEEPMAR